MTPEQRRARARLAALSRHAPESVDVGEVRRELRASRLADHIRAVVASSPALTEAQREELVSLLRDDQVVVA